MRFAFSTPLALTLACLCAPPALAQPADDPHLSAAYEACIEAVDDHLPDSGNRWGGVSECLSAENARLDQQLAAAYAALRERYPGDRFAVLLDRAARDWTTYRDSFCAYDAEVEPAPYPEIAREVCRMEMMQAQVRAVGAVGR